MSKDLTPEELLLLEKHMVATHGESHSLWAFMENITMNYKGETWPLRSKEQVDQRKQYPMLGKLMNHFEQVHRNLSEMPGGLDVLARTDQELQQYVDTGKGDENSLVVQWFKGRLDKHFYYSEHNDEFFEEGLYEEARTRSVKVSLQEKIALADTRTANQTATQRTPSGELER